MEFEIFESRWTPFTNIVTSLLLSTILNLNKVFYGHHHGGGGLVVSVLAFYTNDLSSNHAEPLEKNKKRPGLANLKTKYRT